MKETPALPTLSVPSTEGAFRLRWAAIGLVFAAIVILHYTLPRDVLFYHDLLRRFMYVPIILAAVWFGALGGVAVALAAALLSTPHLFFQHWHTPTPSIDWAAEMLLYIVVGGLTGLLVERERAQRGRAEQAVNQLEAANANLREQSDHLSQVQETLRQAERLSTLGELAADLAHEVRNPLATMRGTVQILAANPPEEDRREFTQMLLGEIDRLDAVVAGYLRAARPPVVDRGPSDAVAAVDSAVDLIRRQADRARVVIDRSGSDKLRVPMGIGSLTQVFMNLVLNAIQAMPDGGRLSIHCRAIPQCEGTLNTAEIVFADTGPGVSPADREKIFRPFFTTKPTGTGLGLGIARRIVQEHGGSLTLDEARDGGAVFRLRLPLVET